MATNKQKKITKFIAIGIAIVFVLTSVSTLISVLAM